jgi:hypothetical protein
MNKRFHHFFWLFILLFLGLILSFNSAEASDGSKEWVLFRIDSELNVPMSKTASTITWTCNRTTGYGSITDGTASESDGGSLDGIIKTASNSLEMTHAGCTSLFNGVTPILEASISDSGWVTRQLDNIIVTASNSGPFTKGASMDYTITINGVNDELGYPLILDGDLTSDMHASVSYDGFVASSSYYNGKAYIAGSTSGGLVTAYASGYIRSSSTNLTISSTASQSVDFGSSANSSINMAGLNYSVVVNGIADELGNTLTLNGSSASASYSGSIASSSYSGGRMYIAANQFGNAGRIYQSSAFYNGKIYSWSGSKGGMNLSNSIEIYDIDSGVWSSGSSGGTARSNATSALYNGKIYFWGGIGHDDEFLNSVDIYDIATDTWSSGNAGGTPRYYHSSVFYNGKMYSWGGYRDGWVFINTLDIYDISTGIWSSGRAGGTPRVSHSSVVYDGKIYFLGGMDSDYNTLKSVDVYDIENNTWSVGIEMPTSRTSMSSIVYGGKIYLWGGMDSSSNVLNTLIIYDPAQNLWSSGASGGIGRFANGSIVDDNTGKIYFFEGLDVNYNFLFSIDIYDINLNSWSAGSTTGSIKAISDGYVTRSSGALSLSTTNQKSLDFGTIDNSNYNELGLQFAHKIQAYVYGGTFTANLLTIGGVTAGDNYGIVCTGNSGYWYCPVPVANTGILARYANNGWITTYASYTDRTSGIGPQTIGTLIVMQAGGGGSSSSGGSNLAGGGSDYGNITFLNSTPMPTPTPSLSPVPTLTPTPTITPSSSISFKLYRKSNDTKVYIMDNSGSLTWIKTLEEFNTRGYQWKDVEVISATDFNNLTPTAGAIMQVISGIKLNIRSTPNINGKIIGKLSGNQRIQTYGKTGLWFKILFNNNDAYVHGNYLR